MKAIDIARWLAVNHETLVAMLTQGPMKERDKVEALKLIVAEENRDLTYEEISIAFEDERLKLILDRYYLKELH